MAGEGFTLAAAQEMLNEAQRLINISAHIASEKSNAATELTQRGRRM
jgi:hypothetical protein